MVNSFLGKSSGYKREIIMPVSSAGVVSRSMKKPLQHQKSVNFMSLAKESIKLESILFVCFDF